MGEGVDGVAPGDRVGVQPMIVVRRLRGLPRRAYALCPRLEHLGVARPGGFAQELCAPAANLPGCPTASRSTEAALLDCVAVAVHAVHRVPVAGGRPRGRERHGRVGLAVAQVARRRAPVG